jgi:nitroreductase
MEVSDAIRVRKSVRAYDSKEIPDDVLTRILEAGRISPSASNTQSWHFIVVKDAAKRKTLSQHRWTKFLTESPVVIVGCGDKKDPDWYVIDVSIALQTMVLAATGEGIGTCWIGDFDEDEVRELCKIPKNFSVVCLLALGYPREKFDLGRTLVGKRRKKLPDIVSYEEFGRSEPG